MKIKGFDKFREKLPALNNKRLVLLPIYSISCIILAFLALFGFLNLSIFIISFPEFIWLSWVLPILGVLIILLSGFILTYQMWFWRDRLKAKYPKTCYQRIFFIGFAGIICVICVGIFNAIPIVYFPPYNNSTLITYLFIRPVYQFWVAPIWIFDLLRLIIGHIIVVIGTATIIRSFFTFGMDYMTVVYLYYPEESTIQEHKIYSILRHPTYAGIIYVSFAGIVIQFSMYSMIFFIIYIIGFTLHINLVEEKELIQRFGDFFKTYRKQVPAFLVRPRQWGLFFKVLLGKS